MGKSFFYNNGFLARLRRNQAGNTLAIVAAAIIPLMGLIGGGIDMSRLYLTKARLQQACDAGALAGRKQMASGAWNASSNRADAVAKQLFDANFKSGSYGTGTRVYSFSESGGKVTGNASTPVPMTIMRIFGAQARTVAVTCDAEMRIPNTDVMFVLDTTGSMGDTNPGDTSPKINGLRRAVNCFYEALMKLDTNADCGSTPSGGNSSGVQLRFGFMPYSVNVNVGRLLRNDWVADRWEYQSREPKFRTQTTTSTSEGQIQLVSSKPSTTSGYGGWSRVETYTGVTSSSACDRLVPADDYGWTGTEIGPLNVQTSQSGNSITYTAQSTQIGFYYDYEVESYSSGQSRCRIQRRARSAVLTRDYRRVDTVTTSSTQVFDQWLYKPVEFDIRGLKAGDKQWNNSVNLPIGSGGTDAAVTWDGCVEERRTVSASSYDPIPPDARDLDIDLVPSTSDVRTQWKPILQDATWGRYTVNSRNQRTNQLDPVLTSDDLDPNRSPAYCPTEARRLQTWGTASTFEAYVNSLRPTGNTYHDIGLIWGARFLSPTGLFASDNAFTPNGGQIERHLIFMTDGDTVTNAQDYSAYGIAWWDRRTTSNTGQITNQVNARFSGLCEEIKRRRITLWVISFGSGVNADSISRLRTCASQGRFFEAKNSQTLIDQFKAIASEISQLRLTK